MPDPERIQVEVDLNSLTWNDLEQLEELAGHHHVLSELGDLENLSASTARALITWKMRQSDPSFDGNVGTMEVRNASFRLKRQDAPARPTTAGDSTSSTSAGTPASDSEQSSATSTAGPQT